MLRRLIVERFEQPFVLLDRDFSLGKPPFEDRPWTLRGWRIALLDVLATAARTRSIGTRSIRSPILSCANLGARCTVQ
jgi:hypothetical protein